MTTAWNETSLPIILSRYELTEIYNADEFNLFYQGLPKKVLHVKGEKCGGGKQSKVRVIEMVAASAAGEKLSMFVIGKSSKPICFKNVKSFPCRYRLQEKSWKNSFLFDEWVKELAKRFKKENCKVVLIVDNCPAHLTFDSSTKHNIKNTIYETRCDTFPKDKVSQKNHSKSDQSSGHEENISRNINFGCDATITIRLV